MNNAIKQKLFYSLMGWIILSLFSVNLYADTLISPIQRIKAFSERLDSLDIVKQTLKRKGTDITDIEIVQGKLRDSLEAIKKELNNQLAHKSSLNNLEKAKKVFPFLKDSSDFFDLLIIGMAILAVISGLLLIRELYRSIKLKKIKKSEKTESNKTTSLPKPPPAYPDYSNIPRSLREYINHKEEGKKETEINSKLEDIQLKEAENLEKENELEKLNTLMKEEIPIGEKVIKAARMGFDVNTISKKFHLSVDEVTLILKVEGSKPKKR